MINLHMLKLCHSLDDTHTLYRQEQKNNSSKLNRLNILTIITRILIIKEWLH